jgi:hypothetical protein
MSWGRVALFYVVLAALAAEYWVVERSRPPAAAGRPARRRLLQVRLDDVREIHLRRAGREVEARRTGAQWAVVEPPDAPVPPDLIAAFAETLLAAEEIDAMTLGADAHAYGLGEGAGEVELVTAGGEAVRLTLGGTNPTGTAVYARRAGTPEVLLIGRNVGYYEDLIFQSLPVGRAPALDDGGPVGG